LELRVARVQGLKVEVRLQDLGFRDYLSISMIRRGREEDWRRRGEWRRY
jgi:hypothetical protein